MTPEILELRPAPTARGDDEPCFTCDSSLDACEGCGEARCLVCDPYLSDDCRWTI